MLVSSIGFNTRHVTSFLYNVLYFIFVNVYTYYIWLYMIIIKRSGGVEGTLDLSTTPVKIFKNWKLNGVCAHDFFKLYLLLAGIAINQYDILYLSETVFR